MSTYYFGTVETAERAARKATKIDPEETIYVIQCRGLLWLHNIGYPTIKYPEKIYSTFKNGKRI